ncbi:epididymis-specific alpha-mannosidase-like [Siphateles boraxobius]|uniref:epididymis-specific alpha-mannosidase-like n=1 Tax=Siphateles boraxobius TaxID=180520 RepID=UPI0040629396
MGNTKECKISPCTEKPLNPRERCSGPSVQPVVLPQNLHMQTLSVPGWNYSPDHTQHLHNLSAGGERKIDFDRILLRITHLYEVGEDPVLSQPITINLKAVMRGMGEVTDVQERSLTGTWDISDLQRWSWKTNERKEEETDFFSGVSQDFNVTIHPKEIRTFFIHFK